MKHILLIESKVLGAFDIVTRLKTSRGYRFSFLTCDLDCYMKADPNARQALDHLERIVTVRSSTNGYEVLPAVMELHQRDPIDAVLTLNDPHIEICSKIARQLSLVYASVESIHLARRKHLLRKKLGECGVSQPQFGVAQTIGDAIATAKKIGYPVIGKPVDGHASYLTKKIESESDLKEHCEQIFTSPGFGRGAKTAGIVLIEECLEGSLISVEGLTVNSRHRAIGIANRILTGAPDFIEIGGSFPVKLANEADILAVWENALDAIEFDQGPSHTEILLTESGPKIIEINGRLAGGPVPEIIDLAFASDIYDVVVSLHLGETFSFPERPVRYCSNLSLYSKDGGYLKAISRSPLAKEDYVGKYRILPKVGDKVRPLKSNFDRLGFIVCTGRSEEMARDRVRRIYNSTQLLIEPEVLCRPS